MLPLLFLFLPGVVLVIVPPATRPWVQWAGASVWIRAERVAVRVGVGVVVPSPLLNWAWTLRRTREQKHRDQDERQKWT
jgi:hypothetical protein